MAEIDRDLLVPLDRENCPLAAGAALVLAYLWTFVPTAQAVRYKHEPEPRRAPRVRWNAAAVAEHFRITQDSASRHLRALIKAGYVRPDPQDADRYALLDSLHRQKYLEHELRSLRSRPATNVKSDEGRSDVNSVGDDLDKFVGSDVNRVGSDVNSVGAIPTELSPLPLRVPINRSQLGHESGSPARTRGAAIEPKDFLALALEIVSGCRAPEGAAPIPATKYGVRHLVALLAGGHPADDVIDVLAVAPELVAEELERVEFYGSEMFLGATWTHWRNSRARLKARGQLSAAPAAAEPAMPRAPDLEDLLREREAQQQRAEAQQLAQMLAEIERPPVPGPYERRGARGLPRWRVALLFNPFEAQRAGRAAIAAARNEGRELACAELAFALASVVVTDDMIRGDQPELEIADVPQFPTEDPVLARLREARRQAEAEGRRLTLDELQQIGRP